jgi:aldehyde:ferredoxin oxidoreductase
MALTYATAPRGACHLQGDFYTIDTPRDGVPELGIFPGDKNSSVGKAEQVVKFQNYNEIYNSLALCKFSPLTSTMISEMLSSITGWECTPEDLLTFGERSVNLKRAINNKLGITRKDDKLPKIAIKALKEGATAGQSPDMALLLKDYYRLNDWDWNTGKPSRAKLLSLELDDVARDLWK